jgi:hypothetical protein
MIIGPEPKCGAVKGLFSTKIARFFAGGASNP